jgi:hypothetical protein
MMSKTRSQDSKYSRALVMGRIVVIQLVGFGLVITALWVDEIIDFPHNFLFPGQPQIFDWTQSLFESVLVLCPFVLTTVLLTRLVGRIRHLEGFLLVCGVCKRVRVEDEWIPMEMYISARSEAVVSHGFCPDCVEKHYASKLKDR